MQPLRIRIDRIVDQGIIVSLIGFDLETDQPVTVHVDHRPLAAADAPQASIGSPEPIEYVADRLTLHLAMLPAEDADKVLLIEHDSPAAGDQGQVAREVEQ